MLAHISRAYKMCRVYRVFVSVCLSVYTQQYKQKQQ